MAKMNMIQAVNDALRTEMRNDSDVILLGEDIGKFYRRSISKVTKNFELVSAGIL